MTLNYSIEISSFKTIKVLPNSWNNEDYKNLLTILDYGDITEIAEKDLEETCLLYLADNEPNDAASIVVKYLMKDALKDSQIDNISHEMMEEKLWEEYADLSKHELFFNAGQLLYKAYNGVFPMPEAIAMSGILTIEKPQMKNLIIKEGESALIKMLVKGMPENTILKRLYKQQLNESPFEDACDIIWQLELIEMEGLQLRFNVISSHYWFHDLKYVENFNGQLNIDE